MTAHVNPHSLRLPAWGPYTKRYAGISHVPDERLGLRFDLSVFPGVYRRRVDLPNVMWESGFHPWEATADLAYYCYRHEVEWKDRVYVDVAYAADGDDARLIACTLVNATDVAQQLSLHYMASLHFPPLRPYAQTWLRPVVAALPDGAMWVDALDYADMRYATPRHMDHLVYEGWLRGETRGHGFVDGRGLGAGFGREAGDMVRYDITLDAPMANAVLILRFRADAEAPAAFACAGLHEGVVTLPGEGDLSKAAYQFAGDGPFSLVRIALGDLPVGAHTLTLVATGTGAVELDGFVLVPAERATAVEFPPVAWQPTPTMQPGPTEGSLLLRYAQAPEVYGLAWGHPLAEVREFYTATLDKVLPRSVHNHTAKRFDDDGEGHYTNVFLRPILLEPGESRTVYGLVCAGDAEAVRTRLAAFDPDSPAVPARIAAARAGVAAWPVAPAGEPYRFSQERMAATMLTNVVYPVYTRRSYIKHYTPGRIWDCLYTWDSGFIGLGLAELDTDRATDCLKAYLTEPGDPHAAFLHHGTPLPVQVYLCHELWQKTRDRALLEHAYPRLRQMHEFLCGNIGGSTTRNLSSNLLRTWDYFYNSGGWDDYPPQKHVHAEGLAATVTPVVNTAHAIRTAKLLRMAALAVGATDDIAQYDAEIALFTDALQQHAWDEASGYFGYVRHEDGRPVGILRHAGGENFDMGLDGVSPLVAGACTPAQEARLLAHLADPARLMTPIGLSTVDQSAAYYRIDGYWNGAVWMPHQWFVWKALLDLGEVDLAFTIAHAALDCWKGEVDASYNCCEHFLPGTRRGAGWHQFGGLSSPVLSWFGAYYRPGRLTLGYDAWMQSLAVADGTDELRARLALHGRPDHRPGAIVALRPGPRYAARWNGALVDMAEPRPGLLHLRLPTGMGEGELWVGADR